MSFNHCRKVRRTVEDMQSYYRDYLMFHNFDIKWLHEEIDAFNLFSLNEQAAILTNLGAEME